MLRTANDLVALGELRYEAVTVDGAIDFAELVVRGEADDDYHEMDEQVGERVVVDEEFGSLADFDEARKDLLDVEIGEHTLERARR